MGTPIFWGIYGPLMKKENIPLGGAQNQIFPYKLMDKKLQIKCPHELGGG